MNARPKKVRRGGGKRIVDSKGNKTTTLLAAHDGQGKRREGR
jgi:hypothetical protein